jgi:hypothetical protein
MRFRIFLFMSVFLVLSAVPVHAANKYWSPAAAANWNSLSAWASTDGGTDYGSAPSSSDDVFFTSTKNQNCTITAAANAKSVNFTGGAGYAGTVTHNDSVTLTLVGDIAFSSAMTYTPVGSASRINVTGTSSVTTNGKVPWYFSMAGATVTLQDAFACTSFQLNSGTLNTNNQSMTVGNFSSGNSNTRTMNLGSSVITITGTGTNGLNMSTITNLTFNVGTSHFVITGVLPTIEGGGLTYYDMSVTPSASSPIIKGNNTFHNLTFAATALGTSISLNGNQTVSNLLTITGNNTANRVLVKSDTQGTARTITVNGTITASYVDLQDITGVGSAWNISGITGGSGNLGGNSGITFTAGTTLYWYQDSGNWSNADPSTGQWWTGSGGTGSRSRVPLAQDTARFDANSFSTTGKTVTMDCYRLGTVDWTGVGADAPTWNMNVDNKYVYGSLTVTSDMSFTNTSNKGIYFAGRRTNTFTSAGKSLYNHVYVDSYNGTLSLVEAGADTLSMSTNNATLLSGTFDLNDESVTFKTFTSTGTLTRTLNMGNGTLTLFSTGTVWDVASTGFTLTPENSTLAITDASGTGKTFAGGGMTYNNLSITGAGAGVVTFTGANTFKNITIGAPKTVNFTAGTTTTITGTLLATGSSGNLVTLNSTSTSAFTLSKASGYVDCDWLYLDYSTVTGGATWYAGANSNNHSNNTGWTFTVPPFFTGGNGRGEDFGSVTEDVSGYLNIYVGGNGRGETYAQAADALPAGMFNAFLLSGD